MKDNAVTIRKRLYDSRRYSKNKQKIWAQVSNYKKLHPWLCSFVSCGSRCNNRKDAAYKYYGKRGIKRLITLKEVEKLWYRDKAYKMKRPCLDRKNPDGNYTVRNCRFIESAENAKLANLYCRHCKGNCKLKDW